MSSHSVARTPSSHKSIDGRRPAAGRLLPGRLRPLPWSPRRRPLAAASPAGCAAGAPSSSSSSLSAIRWVLRRARFCEGGLSADALVPLEDAAGGALLGDNKMKYYQFHTVFCIMKIKNTYSKIYTLLYVLPYEGAEVQSRHHIRMPLSHSPYSRSGHGPIRPSWFTSGNTLTSLGASPHPPTCAAACRPCAPPAWWRALLPPQRPPQSRDRPDSQRRQVPRRCNAAASPVLPSPPPAPWPPPPEAAGTVVAGKRIIPYCKKMHA